MSPVFGLLGRSLGVGPALTKALRPMEHIEAAYLYGSFAKNRADTSSDIDLLVIGQPGLYRKTDAR